MSVLGLRKLKEVVDNAETYVPLSGESATAQIMLDNWGFTVKTSDFPDGIKVSAVCYVYGSNWGGENSQYYAWQYGETVGLYAYDVALEYVSSYDYVVDIISTDNSAVDEWLLANTEFVKQETPLAEIFYNGQVIVSLNAGETTTLSCEGKKMTDDIVITVDEIPEEYLIPTGNAEITENGDYDISDKETITVAVSSPVLEVDELPLTDIKEDTIYSYDGSLWRYIEGGGESESLVGTWMFNETLDIAGLFVDSDSSTIYFDIAGTYEYNGETLEFDQLRFDYNDGEETSGDYSFIYDKFCTMSLMYQGEVLSYNNLGEGPYYQGGLSKAYNDGVFMYAIDNGNGKWYAWNRIVTIVEDALDDSFKRNWFKASAVPVGKDWQKYIIPKGSMIITENSTVDVTDKKEVIVNVTSDNLNINGVIEQYRVHAGMNVNAGDFVEFVNEWNKGEIISTNAYYMSACMIDNTRVLIGYIDLYNVSGYNKHYSLKAQIIKIVDNVIIEGSPCTVSGSSQYLRDVLVGAFTSNRAIVIWGDGSGSSSSEQKGMKALLSLEGDVVTVIDSSNIGTSGYVYSDMALLSENTCLLSYRHSYSGIAGTNIDRDGYVKLLKLADDQLSTTSTLEFFSRNAYQELLGTHLVRLSPTKALLMVRDSYTSDSVSNYYNRCYVVGTENGVLSIGSSCIIPGVNTTRYVGDAVDEGTVVCVVGNMVQVVKIDGTKASFGEAIPFGTYIVTTTVENEDGTTTETETETPIPITAPSVVAISNDKAVIAYKNTNDGKSYVVVVTVSGMDIILGIPVVYDEGAVDINQLIAFSDSSVVNIFANEFIAGVGMTTIDGVVDTWELNDELDLPSLYAIEPDVEHSGNCYELEFSATINGVHYDHVYLSVWKSNSGSMQLQYRKSQVSLNSVYTSNKWDYVDAKTIEITSEPKNSAVANWIRANGKRKGISINQLTSTYVQPATSRLHNVGVAKTGGVEGDKVEVYCVG